MKHSKSDLRKYVKEKRKIIKDKDYLDNIIKNKLLQNEYIKNSQDILVYLSKELEVDTFKLINELLKLGKNIYAPCVIDSKLEFYKLSSLEDIKLSSFNIYEPIGRIKYNFNKSSCIIVPGLLFDKNNNRLGYGGGYYDRFLSNLDIYKIGVCYSEFLTDTIEVEEHDIKMDIVITER